MANNKTKQNKNTENNSANTVQPITMADDFSAELIRQINKEAGEQIAYNLGAGQDAPTYVKTWVSTGSKLLDYIISNRRNGGLPGGRIVELQGPFACHAKGDTVLMYDGTIKKIEDIKVGDQLMGPDSTPRNVLDLVRGKDKLFKLIPNQHGKTYHVSANHLLPLTKTNKKHLGVKYIELPVKEFIKKSNWFKKCYSLTRKIVEFDQQFFQPITIPPYILGLLLGDGHLNSKKIGYTTADKILEKEYTDFCQSYGYKIRFHQKLNNLAKDIAFKVRDHVNNPSCENKIRNELFNLGLLNKKSGDKFIPQCYKIRSIQDRLELLAGLIDTDGNYQNDANSYEYCSKSKQLIDDFIFVARSVGMKVGEPIIKTVKGVIYYRVRLSGSKIPCKLERKKCNKIHRIPWLSHQFKLESIGEGDIYGVTVDKDHLYLMEDMTVQRNCGKSTLSFEIAKHTQMMGGMVAYFDTENATSPENLAKMGINVHKNFIFFQTNCTEDVFKFSEAIIMKANAVKKNVPITIIWDSVAGCAPKAELEAEYEDQQMGLQARVLGKGLRKISGIIGNHNVLFLLVNQQRQKLGVMFGNPCVSPETQITIRRKISH